MSGVLTAADGAVNGRMGAELERQMGHRRAICLLRVMVGAAKLQVH